MRAQALRDLLAAADPGPWWYDNRDIFHKDPNTNLDQIIIPIPDKAETYHESQAVRPQTAQLAALAPQLANLLLRMGDALAYWLSNDFHELGDIELAVGRDHALLEELEAIADN